MSRDIIKVIKCDICDTEPATPWRLNNGADTVLVDLCAEHQKPLLAMMRKGNNISRARKNVVQQPVAHPKRRLRSA